MIRLLVLKNKNPKYPYYVKLHGKKIKIPQQKKWGTYCQAHGCGVTAASIGVQWTGVRKGDGTIYSPEDIYNYAKAHVSGYNGSKLSPYGQMRAINKLAGKKVAFWHPITSNNKENVLKSIKKFLQNGNIIILEQDNPIHTVVLLKFNPKNGNVRIATNGRITTSKLRYQIYSKALYGSINPDNQRNWYCGREHCGGYVVVQKG